MSDAEYVEGDVNVVAEPSGPVAPIAARVLRYIAEAMADDPSAVSVEVGERHDRVVLSLNVAPDEMGRIIGRRGRTAQAIRVVVGAAGVRDGVTTSVDIVD